MNNVLDLTGPEFLIWYLQWFAVCAGAGLVLRWLIRRPPWPVIRLAPLDPYEVAWLQGGPAAVVSTALASLYQRKLIDMKLNLVVPREDAQAPPLRGFEAAAWRALDGSSSKLTRFVRALRPECQEIAERLEREGLAVSPARRAAVRFIPLIGLMLLMAIGVAKVWVGLERNHPVGFLVLLLVATGVTLVCAARFVPRATAAGSKWVFELRDRHAALRTTLRSDQPGPQEPEDVALAVGLWGPAVLTAGMFAALAAGLAPLKASANSGVASMSSATGCGGDPGGGDAGGGGCGGGGCGGGGCGGCGG